MMVKKADGSLEKFDGWKIMRTCSRAGLDENQSATVLAHVEKKAYDRIPTNALMKIILKEIRKHDGIASMKYSLRAALAALSPEGIFFEHYVKKLLEQYGYKVKHSQIVGGSCVEHEIDLVAEKDNKKIMVECKHHSNYHALVGLGDALVAWAAFEDTKNKNNFEEAWLVSNAKISEHAVRYSQCKGMRALGWTNELSDMIESKKFYPVTILEATRNVRVEKAFNAGLVSVGDVITSDTQTLKKVFGEKSAEAVEEAKNIMAS